LDIDRSGSIKDINENCLAEFRTHWQCLENHNQQLWNCRSEERKLNKCVFEKLVCRNITLAYLCLSLTLLQKLEKTIPDAPKGETPVHLRTRNIFATH
jgi:NADH dehydrogenase (ubiquinone) 1 alpha subcomplex subunit 8